jgi:hypothetical protein
MPSRHKNMTETKSKIEGKRHPRKPARNVGPARKEFITKVLGLESHTFDIGNTKYAAKYQKTVDAIANHIQKEYKGGPEIAKAIRDLSLPTIASPEYPRPSSTTALQLTQERYSCGSRTSPRQRRELCFLPRIRSTCTPLSSTNAHQSLRARSKVQTCTSKPTATRTWSSSC